MVYLLYSGVSAQGIRAALGQAEYSYYFLLKGFLPMLREMGEVILVQDPEREVDEHYAQCRARGESCLFICFTPPNLAPVGLRCPTLTLFAWEFSTIPDTAWDNHPGNDWRTVLAAHGACIVSSGHSAAVVREAMGESFPVAALPAPVWDDLAPLRTESRDSARVANVSLPVSGYLYDSATVDYDINNLISPVFPNAASAPAASNPGNVDPAPAAPAAPDCVEFSGIVYTSVFNPNDGRKAYYDILTAFCTAFRDREDAVLLFKMTHTNPDTYRHNMHHVLHQLWPFKCRVIAFNGFLEDADFRAMIRGSSYYVNASHCEGLCLPLAEFLSAGVPAIAPAHTAMADYISEDLAFVLRSSVEINVWPNDPRDLYTTTRYRNDWGSLVQAFEASYALASNDDAAWCTMSQTAMQRMQQWCSRAAVAQRLQSFLAGLPASLAAEVGIE